MSALWILVANGWMQNPVGAEFNYQTMRMELTNFAALIFNPVAQSKFVHTVAVSHQHMELLQQRHQPQRKHFCNGPIRADRKADEGHKAQRDRAG
jgi:hypothetical protein